MYTIHPDDAVRPDGTPRPSRHLGLYRAPLLDRRRTAMHWHIRHDGARHWRAWRRRRPGEPMPLAIAFGGESVLPYAATAPMPPGISELLLAGFLHNAAIELVRCTTVDLHVPAHSEIVIEGHVSTKAGEIGLTPDNLAQRTANADSVIEGPFGDHTGFYSLPDRYPVFTVTAITHRRDPIYPTTIVGPPPQEDYYLGKATERIFRPLLQTLIPDILDYDLPMFGAFHNCAFVQIRKEYPLQARRVMHAIWGAGQMAWTKIIVVVDQDVDVHDHEQVLFHLCANCDPARDVEVTAGPLDILDHAAPQLGAGNKIGFDATRKLPAEAVAGHAVRNYPPFMTMTDAIKQQVDRRWAEFGLD
jgi:4-hydroxy-3-polyprenylbenzoate decarboxylase